MSEAYAVKTLGSWLTSVIINSAFCEGEAMPLDMAFSGHSPRFKAIELSCRLAPIGTGLHKGYRFKA